MKKKYCVYTCITGDYDGLKELKIKEKDIDYYCFTNNKKLQSKTWKVIYIDNNDMDDITLARKIKILGNDDLFKDYEFNIWIDACITIEKNLTEWLDNKINKHNINILMYKHNERNCIYDEAIECFRVRKETKKNVVKLINFLEKEKMPKNYGLYSTGIIVRNNNSLVKETMKIWFSILEKYSRRDQLSFTYALYKTGLKVKPLGNNLFKSDVFTWNNHKKLIKNNKIRVYYDDNNFDISKVEDYLFKETNNIISIEIIKDTNKLMIDLSNMKNMFLINYKTSSKVNFTLENYYKVGNYTILNDNSILSMIGNFKKKDIIKIELNMRKLNEEEIIDILKYSSEIELKLNEQVKENETLKNNYNTIINSKGWKILEKLRNIKHIKK